MSELENVVESPVEAVTDVGSESGQTEETNYVENEEVGNASTENASEGDTSEKDPDTEKWMGKRLERAKAKEREAATAEIEYWKQQAQSKQAPQVPTVQVSQDKPQLGQYETVEGYTEALTDWKLDQRFAAQQQQTMQQKSLGNFQTRMEAFAAKTPDYVAAVQSLIDDYKNVNVEELNKFCLDSEVGPELAYHIAKNPHLMDKILELPSHRRYVELGKLEDKFSKKEIIPPKVSKAPAPITPEKGSTISEKTLTDPNLSQAEYRELRMNGKKRK